MPVQAPQWTEFLSCPICYNMFNETGNRPISLGCGHTVCKSCLTNLHQKRCPFDQSVISRDLEDLPVNFALLQLVGVAPPKPLSDNLTEDLPHHVRHYNMAKHCIEELAMYLKPVSSDLMPGQSSPPPPAIQAVGVGMANNTPVNSILSRPMQRKLVALVNCQLVEDEGRARAIRAARSLGERTVTELILQHQNPQQLSANLWAAVRARGCQFLGPAMQEEVLKLILLALEDGSALSRKVLVLFVVQRLENQYPHASKTAIGHVVQLLYRASCFKVTKRDEESSLMQLKEEFRCYEALRREHDSQIVQIATEAGLRISPEQWSSLLYGDTGHKSHMQSIIDKLQTPQSFLQSVNELIIALQRSGDPGNLSRLRPHFDLLASIDPNPESPTPMWETLEAVMTSVQAVVHGLVEFITTRVHRKPEVPPAANPKYKTSMCRDLQQRGRCPRGNNCTFAHSQEEMERFRAKNKKFGKAALTPVGKKVPTSAALTAKESQEFMALVKSTESKLLTRSKPITMTTHLGAAGLVSSDIREGITLGQGLVIPIAKPSNLPMMGKANCQQTIYTSPTPSVKEGERPRALPVPHRMPSYSATGTQVHDIRKTPISSSMVLPPGEASSVLYGEANQKKVTTSVPWAAVIPAIPPDETFLRKTMSLPPNPYTAELSNLPVDSYYYLPSNVQKTTRGKSPSQQLEELHRRREELLLQLNKTPVSSTFSVSSSSSSSSSCMSTSPSSLQKSYADSLASTHTSMSFSRHQDSASMYTQSLPQSLPQWIPASLTKDEEDDKLPVFDLQNDQSDLSDYYEKENFDTLDYSQCAWPIDTCSVAELEDLIEGDDEFIPFEHTVVSKYGPISRMVRAKLKQNGGVQVTAGQIKQTIPVTAVTPVSRPYPMSVQVPSRFQPQGLKMLPTDHMADPNGTHVATSLPTALMQPNVIAASACKPKESLSLVAMREMVLNDADSPAPGQSTKKKKKIQTEIRTLTEQIENLEMCEDERLARELQAIELNIQEKERQMHLDCEEEQKRIQEEQDRRLAEQIVLAEARQKGYQVHGSSTKQKRTELGAGDA